MSEKMTFNQINDQESSAYAQGHAGDDRYNPNVLVKRSDGSISVGRYDKSTHDAGNLPVYDASGNVDPLRVGKRKMALEAVSDQEQEALAAELAGEKLRVLEIGKQITDIAELAMYINAAVEQGKVTGSDETVYDAAQMAKQMASFMENVKTNPALALSYMPRSIRGEVKEQLGGIKAAETPTSGMITSEDVPKSVHETPTAEAEAPKLTKEEILANMTAGLSESDLNALRNFADEASDKRNAQINAGAAQNEDERRYYEGLSRSATEGTGHYFKSMSQAAKNIARQYAGLVHDGKVAF